MFYKTQFLLSTCLFCFALAACDNKQTNEATATEKTVQPAIAVEVLATTMQANSIEVGMSERAVANLLGDATIIQTRILDSLTITNSEWTNDAGTTSVQFQNGKAQSSQFIPSNK
jgi:hypothetical protein